ncbi:hypothetical protein FQA47_023094 [Oryzias melastigma]|uniref:Uncharacterized protein n=1 Tax=Oryzias melastigma TaxID=30732 RepID=A0A834CM96_ORYME|nr:hypothetical protein FQA47_023094 [Oryzias melastigma]
MNDCAVVRQMNDCAVVRQMNDCAVVRQVNDCAVVRQVNDCKAVRQKKKVMFHGLDMPVQHMPADSVHAASGFGPCSRISTSRCSISLTAGAGLMSPSQLVWTDMSDCLPARQPLCLKEHQLIITTYFFFPGQLEQNGSGGSSLWIQRASRSNTMCRRRNPPSSPADPCTPSPPPTLPTLLAGSVPAVVSPVCFCVWSCLPKMESSSVFPHKRSSRTKVFTPHKPEDAANPAANVKTVVRLKSYCGRGGACDAGTGGWEAASASRRQYSCRAVSRSCPCPCPSPINSIDLSQGSRGKSVPKGGGGGGGVADAAESRQIDDTSVCHRRLSTRGGREMTSFRRSLLVKEHSSSPSRTLRDQPICCRGLHPAVMSGSRGQSRRSKEPQRRAAIGRLSSHLVTPVIYAGEETGARPDCSVLRRQNSQLLSSTHLEDPARSRGSTFHHFIEPFSCERVKLQKAPLWRRAFLTEKYGIKTLLGFLGITRIMFLHRNQFSDVDSSAVVGAAEHLSSVLSFSVRKTGRHSRATKRKMKVGVHTTLTETHRGELVRSDLPQDRIYGQPPASRRPHGPAARQSQAALGSDPQDFLLCLSGNTFSPAVSVTAQQSAAAIFSGTKGNKGRTNCIKTLFCHHHSESPLCVPPALSVRPRNRYKTSAERIT